MGWTGNSPNKTYSRSTGLQSGTTSWADTEAASRGIESTDHDTHDQDIADGINTSLQKDGKNKATANIDMGGFKLTTLGTPTSSGDAANKSYVDGVAVALVNFTVRLASTANVNLTTDVDAGSTFDGTALVQNDRILLKNQTAAAENGIYVVPAALGTATRATDMDTWTETLGAIVNVTAGSAGANTSWRSTTNSGGTIDVTSLTFTTFGTSLTTPISIANGGTANTTAAAAFSALKQDFTTAAAGVCERATVAEVQAGTATTVPTAADIASSGAETALSDGATITVDFSTGFDFGVTLAGNRTLAASNYTGLIGRSGHIRFTQDGTGTRTLNTSASPWVNASATDVVLTTTAAAVDFVFYKIVSIGGSAKIFLSISKGIG